MYSVGDRLVQKKRTSNQYSLCAPIILHFRANSFSIQKRFHLPNPVLLRLLYFSSVQATRQGGETTNTETSIYGTLAIVSEGSCAHQRILESVARALGVRFSTQPRSRSNSLQNGSRVPLRSFLTLPHSVPRTHTILRIRPPITHFRKTEPCIFHFQQVVLKF